MRWRSVGLVLAVAIGSTGLPAQSARDAIVDSLAAGPLEPGFYSLRRFPLPALFDDCDGDPICLDAELAWLAETKDTLYPQATEYVYDHLKRRKQHRAGRAYLQRGIAVARRLGLTLPEAQLRLRLGSNYNNSGDHPDSTAHYLYGALELFRSQDSDRSGLALYQLAYFHQEIGMIDQAFEELEAAYRIERPTGIRMRYGNDLYSLITLALVHDRPAILDRYLPLYQEFRATSKFIDGKHDAILNLVSGDARHFATLERYVRRYLQEGDTTNQNPNHALATYAVGLRARGRYGEAETALRRAIAHSLSVDRQAVAAADYYQLYLLGKAAGRPELMIEGLERYGELRTRLAEAQQRDNIASLEVEFATQRTRAELVESQLALATAHRQRNLLLVGGTLLLLFGLLGYLLLRNRSRLRALRAARVADRRARELEAAGLAAESDRLRALIDGQEGERARVARDLNDGLGGLLTTVKAHIRELPRADGAAELIDRACTSVRRIASNMMPQTLTVAGLSGSLEDLAEQLRSQDLEVVMRLDGDLDGLSLRRKTALLRIVQELTHNVSKHARARTIHIELRRADGRVTVEVRDDGRGFNLDYAEGRGGLGLRSVRQRVTYLGGTIDFASKPDRGTAITVSVPAGGRRGAGAGSVTPGRAVLSLLFLLGGAGGAFAQPDSLHRAVETAWEERDHARLDTLLPAIFERCAWQPDCLRREAAFARNLSDRLTVNFYDHLSAGYTRRTDHSNARVAIDSFRAASVRHGYAHGRGIALKRLVENLIVRGQQLDSAAHYAYRALEVFSATDSLRRATVYHQLARIHLKTNQVDAALTHMKEAYRLARNQSRKDFGFILYHLVLYASDAGRQDVFDRYFPEYLAFREGGRSVNAGHDAMLAYLAGEDSAYRAMKQYLAADRVVEDGLVTDYEMLLGVVAEEAMARGHYAEAREYLERGIDFSHRHGRTGRIGTLYQLLARLGRETDDLATVAYALEEDLALKDSLAKEEYRRALERMEVEFASQQSRERLAETRLALLDARRSRDLLLLLGLLLGGTLLFGGGYYRYRTKLQGAEADLLRERQEEQLEQLQRAGEMDGLRAMIQGQEAERERVARELHDGLGGLLTTVKSRLHGTPDGETAMALIDRAATAVRRIAHEMMPRTLGLSGLAGGLEDLAAQLRLRGYEVDFSVVGDPDDRINDSARNMILRIAQELTQNVVRHAAANSIFLQLIQERDRLLLTVEDDGIGASIDALTTGTGLGLSRVRQRSAWLGADLLIDGSPGQGTTVTVEVPTVAGAVATAGDQDSKA